MASTPTRIYRPYGARHSLFTNRRASGPTLRQVILFISGTAAYTAGKASVGWRRVAGGCGWSGRRLDRTRDAYIGVFSTIYIQCYVQTMLRLIGGGPAASCGDQFRVGIRGSISKPGVGLRESRKRPPAQPIDATLSNRLIERDLFISEPSGTIRGLDRMPFRLNQSLSTTLAWRGLRKRT